MGSAHETEYVTLFPQEYGLVSKKTYEKLQRLLDEIKSMLCVLINKNKS